MPRQARFHINVLGPSFQSKDINEILDSKLDFDDPESLSEAAIHAHYLEMFFERPISTLSKPTLLRFLELTTEELLMPFTVSNKDISDRLVQPLVSAKRNYSLGDYVASIAMSGSIAEMLAILIWLIEEKTISKKEIDEEIEKQLFGSEFEKLGQDKRIKVLLSFGFISKDQYERFRIVKEARRPYLHLWSRRKLVPREDAKQCYINVLHLFKEISGIKVKNRTISFNQKFTKIL